MTEAVDHKADTFADFVGDNFGIDLVVADTDLGMVLLADTLAQDTDYTCLVVAVVDKKHLRFKNK